MKRLKIILKSRYLIKISTIILLIISIIFTKCYNFRSKYNIKDNTFIGIVYNYKIEDGIITIYLKAKEKLVVYFKYNDLIFNNLSYGDKIIVKGKLSVPKSSTNFNIFDYRKYLYNKKIYYIVNADSIDKIENNSNYLYTIKNILYKKIDKLKSKDYIKTLLFGDNNLTDEINNSYRINGVSHLFSISGMHISLIIGIIYFYLDRVTYNKKIKYIITDIFLLSYYLLVNTSSLFRSIIMYILFSINFIFKLDINKKNIMFLTLIIAILINPFIIYDMGFIYSYIISFFLVVYGNNKKINNKYAKFIYTIFLSFIISLPINIYYNSEINLLSIFINVLAVPIVSFIILPLSFITLIFPIFDDILYMFITFLEKLSLFISDINIFRIIFIKPSIIIVIIYYIIIIIILKKNRLFYILIFFLICHKFFPYINNNLEVIMFDVGQGDSILVSFPNNRGNILIDTGKDDNDIKNIVIPYIKSKGISKLDYVIISHGDSDHIGGALYLINNYKVNNIVLNNGDYSEYEYNLINQLGNIKYLKGISKININGNFLYFINNNVFDNENDNSIVTYFMYKNYKFLFMGDSSYRTEEYLINNYNLNNIDFLKVGHHGSDTSSSKEFINSISPKYSLISVGKNNCYGHPKEEVLETLKNSKIYRTDLDGSIEIKLNRNRYKIKICSP